MHGHDDHSKSAWLVAVNLDALAAHLATTYGKPFSPLDARKWLATKESPFYATDRWGTFYCPGNDPAGLLEADEIVSIEPAPFTRLLSRAAPVLIAGLGRPQPRIPRPKNNDGHGGRQKRPVRAIEIDRVFPDARAAAKFAKRQRAGIIESIRRGGSCGKLHWEYAA